MTIFDAPAPLTFAPILLSSAARSATSGSRAAVLEDRFSFGQRRRHHEVFGTGDGDSREDVVRSRETILSDRFDVAGFLADRRAEHFEPGDMEVDRPGADRTATRHRDTRAAGSRHERSEHQTGSTHGLDELVRRLGALDRLGADARAAVLTMDVGADRLEQPDHGADVDDGGYAAECRPRRR